MQRNENQAASGENLEETSNQNESVIQNDDHANISLLRQKIQAGTVMELRSISLKLLDLVEMQQEQILYLSQKLQVINAENIAYRQACYD